jgi:predicted transcriptional regulator
MTMNDELPNSADPAISVYRPDRPGIRKVLGDLEAEIMELIWARPPGEGTTVRDVFEVLYERRRSAYTTVMSTMARLAKKQLLRVERSEQAYIYHPAFSRDEFVSRFVGRILEDLLVGFAEETRAGIESIPDTDAAARARHLLDEIARRRAQEETG